METLSLKEETRISASDEGHSKGAIFNYRGAPINEVDHSGALTCVGVHLWRVKFAQLHSDHEQSPDSVSHFGHVYEALQHTHRERERERRERERERERERREREREEREREREREERERERREREEREREREKREREMSIHRHVS